MAKKERNYGLAADEVKSLRAEYEESKKFPVPYQKGAYRYTIQALLSLGPDEFHPLEKVHQAFKKAAGKEWYEAWATKPVRTETGKDAAGRFTQNLRVLQRTRDFAKSLLEVGRKILRSKGAVIDLARDDAGRLSVRLNLDSDKPQKPGRLMKAGDSPKATKTRKTGQKGQKPRRKAKKAGGKGRTKATATESKPQEPSSDAGTAEIAS